MGVARLQGNDLVAGDAHQHDEQRERPGLAELGGEPLLEVGLHPELDDRRRRHVALEHLQEGLAAVGFRTRPRRHGTPRSDRRWPAPSARRRHRPRLDAGSRMQRLGDRPQPVEQRAGALAQFVQAARRSSRCRGTVPRAGVRPAISRSGSRAARRAMSPSALSRRHAKARARSASLSWASTSARTARSAASAAVQSACRRAIRVSAADGIAVQVEPAGGPSQAPPGRPLLAPSWSSTSPMPAATFRPTLPSTLTGCRVTWPLPPPSRTLAPAPTPTVADAVPPT